MGNIYDGLRNLISDQEERIIDLPLGKERSEAIDDYVSLMDKNIQHDKLDEDVLDRRTKMDMDDALEREKLDRMEKIEKWKITAAVKKACSEHRDGLIATATVAGIAGFGWVSENLGFVKVKMNEFYRLLK